MYVTCSDIQPHNSVLPVTEGSMFYNKKCVFETSYCNAEAVISEFKIWRIIIINNNSNF